MNFTKGKTAFMLPFPEEHRPILQACIAGRMEGPLLRSRRVFEGKKATEVIACMDQLRHLYEEELTGQPAGTVQAEQDRKVLFRTLLRRLGGISEDAMNREFKKLLALVGVQNGATLYALRSSVTTAMHQANLPHLEMRYLTGHTTNDILNEYTTLDPTAAMRKFFTTIQPLLTVGRSASGPQAPALPSRSLWLPCRASRRKWRMLECPPAAQLPATVGALGSGRVPWVPTAAASVPSPS